MRWRILPEMKLVPSLLLLVKDVNDMLQFYELCTLAIDVLFQASAHWVAARPLTTCSGGSALGGDWCLSPPLVWRELLPPLLWLVLAAMMDMLACGS
jgi:hypothetical protein